MTLDAAAHFLTSTLMLLQAVSANPALPPAMQDNARLLAESAVTEGTRAVEKGRIGGAASCTIAADKPNYYAGEVVVFNWEANNASTAQFVTDPLEKPTIQAPGVELGLKGQWRAVVDKKGYPFITMQVTDAAGRTSACSEMVFVH